MEDESHWMQQRKLDYPLFYIIISALLERVAYLLFI